MANSIYQDGDILDYTNATGAALVSGVPFLSGTKVFVPMTNIAISAKGAVAAECVVQYAKNTGASTGGAFGASAYWDNSAKKFTAVSSGNTLAGYFAAVCADGDATCLVKLLG